MMTKKIMNERFFLKLLLALFSALVAAELFLVLLFGLRLELILLCFIMATAFTGIAIVVRLLSQQRGEVDSVSTRRAREKRNDIMRERLREYSVDEEFLGAETFRNVRGDSPAAPMSETQRSTSPPAVETVVSVEQAIRVHAEMYGGLGLLLQMMEKIDDTSFGRLVKKAGFGELSREEVMLKITLMVAEESPSMRGVAESDQERSCILEGYSMERESFDDYIRRSMNGAEGDAECADGFSVKLDGAALSRASGTPPADFSHDPALIISSLKRAGATS